MDPMQITLGIEEEHCRESIAAGGEEGGERGLVIVAAKVVVSQLLIAVVETISEMVGEGSSGLDERFSDAFRLLLH